MSKETRKSQWKGEFQALFSKVKFDRVRPRTREGKVTTDPLRKRAVVTFSEDLLKTRLGAEKYEKLQAARRGEVKTKARFISPKDAIPYQKSGMEPAYLACPMPQQDRPSTAADDILPTIHEEEPKLYDPEFSEAVDRDRLLGPVAPAPVIDLSYLGIDLTTETIWKERGSEYSMEGRKLMSWKYWFTAVGLLSLKEHVYRKLVTKPRIWLYWKWLCFDYVVRRWWSTSRWSPHFFAALYQKMGVKTMWRRFLVARGWKKPPLREVPWEGQEAVKLANGTTAYLAARLDLSRDQGLTQTLAQAKELGVDYRVAIKIWAQHAFYRSLHDWTFEKVLAQETKTLKISEEEARGQWVDWNVVSYAAKESLAENTLRRFVVTLLMDMDLPAKPMPPVAFPALVQKLYNSCKECRGTKQVFNHIENRYVACTASVHEGT